MRIGAVAAGHRVTAEAAAEVLRAGGNAFDAVVAAGLTAVVAEPALTSAGGGGFLLGRPPGGDEVLIDFFVNTPGLAAPHEELARATAVPVEIQFEGARQVFHVGPGSVAVPGCLDGWLQVHRRYGQVDLAKVVRPAQRAAREGVPLARLQAQILALLDAVLTREALTAEILAPSGRVLRAGERLVIPAYADLLDDVAAGRVTGMRDLAGEVEAVRLRGGIVTTEDLAAYRVVEREPLVAEYRGVRIATNPAPSYGGALVVQALERLEEASPAGRWQGQSDEAARIADALVHMSNSHGSAGANPPGPGGEPSRRDRPTLRSSRGTTHVSVADGEGGVAAMTTSNGSCSGVVLPASGIHLNNIMGESDLHPSGFGSSPPGVRVGSMMAPTLLTWPDGSVVALGSGGSERIRSALTLVVATMVDASKASGDGVHGEPNLRSAIAAPRMHWDGSLLQMEPGHPVDLEVPVNVWPAQDLYFGGVHAVAVQVDGKKTAVGDARRGGHGLLVPLP